MNKETFDLRMWNICEAYVKLSSRFSRLSKNCKHHTYCSPWGLHGMCGLDKGNLCCLDTCPLIHDLIMGYY